MGEAKIKEAKRRQQAEKIVGAFEAFIRSLITERDIGPSQKAEAFVQSHREHLIQTLVEPPPK